ncbi:MAG: ion channel [Ignavibacteriales bacterium]|nr:ion channel [Ignavibacteriales bacterium]
MKYKLTNNDLEDYKEYSNKQARIEIITIVIFLIGFAFSAFMPSIRKDLLEPNGDYSAWISNSAYATLLFIIGPILQLYVIRRVGDREIKGYYLFSASRSILMVCILYIMYLVCVQFIIIPCTYLNMLAVLALTFSITLVLDIGTICSHLLGTKEDPNSIFSHGLEQQTFNNLVHFLGLFLCICSLLALAIAFWDGAHNHRSIYSENLFPNKVFENKIENEESTLLYFNSGSAIVESSPSQTPYVQAVLDWRGYLKNYGNSNNGLLNDRMKALNYSSIKFILDKIDSDSLRNSQKRIRIKLIGQTDLQGKDTLNNKFTSNYELSQARTVQVQMILADSLLAREKKAIQNKKRNISNNFNIEWALVPMPNETNHKNLKMADPLRRLVNIIIQPINQHQSEIQISSIAMNNNMELLDYMYFMIYTITTTGYGDIKPKDGFIKFIVSLANIIEVFITVIFFGALIARFSIAKSGGKVLGNHIKKTERDKVDKSQTSNAENDSQDLSN